MICSVLLLRFIIDLSFVRVLSSYSLYAPNEILKNAIENVLIDDGFKIPTAGKNR